jgi:hypothetical protein
VLEEGILTCYDNANMSEKAKDSTINLLNRRLGTVPNMGYNQLCVTSEDSWEASIVFQVSAYSCAYCTHTPSPMSSMCNICPMSYMLLL